jgi:sterol desaturase/sphingolipid hydroxylase (fatty acid hydroxylase superfamily)
MIDLNQPLAGEAAIRLTVFIVMLTAMAAWEFAAPRRRPACSMFKRWSSNLAIALLNTALIRILLPAAAITLALMATRHGWGLLNYLHLPAWLIVAASVILLDLTIYLQHVMFHAVPAFWRIHRMHHADLDFDVTTGIRFHPFEIVLSMLIKLAAVAALGTPAVAILVFEVVLNGTSMFNHGNVRIPARLERVLRWLLVTPEMHRVHHSIVVAETNSNFGFNLSCWDRLLGTYRQNPAAGHEAMTIGIDQFRGQRELWLDRMLSQPFRGPAGPYAMSWRRAA